MTRFHYAFHVDDLAAARTFYVDVIGCRQGRSADKWIDFDFFGHQLSVHWLAKRPEFPYCGQVDGLSVPMPHFGCLLSREAFLSLQQRFEAAGTSFVLSPRVRFAGTRQEQLTMFVHDPSGNPLEFKSFTYDDGVFD